MFDEICRKALAISFRFVPSHEIDRVNIRVATLQAMRDSVNGLSVQPDIALFDGRDVHDGLVCAGRAIIGGDASEPVISAASIIAKVMRDRVMTRLDASFPQYVFGQHKGYGSAKHLKALQDYGPIIHHRQILFTH